MKPFGRKSIYANKALRRWRYRAGHSVHSTFAFRLIREVMASPYPYYADNVLRARYHLKSEQERKAGISLDVGLLWFRLVARMRPSIVYYALSKGMDDARHYGQAADGRVKHTVLMGEPLSHPRDGHRPMLICDQVDDALYFLSHCSPDDEAVVLISGIRRDKASYSAWRTMIDNLDQGIVLDAYDCGIIINRNKHLSVYRAAY